MSVINQKDTKDLEENPNKKRETFFVLKDTRGSEEKARTKKLLNNEELKLIRKPMKELRGVVKERTNKTVFIDNRVPIYISVPPAIKQVYSMIAKHEKKSMNGDINKYIDQVVKTYRAGIVL